jgi:hypothetical protein
MSALALGSGEELLPQTVGAQEPALDVMVEVWLHELAEDLLVHGRVLDWNERLDAAVEVWRIQSADEMNTRASRPGAEPGAEVHDPGVLQDGASRRCF